MGINFINKKIKLKNNFYEKNALFIKLHKYKACPQNKQPFNINEKNYTIKSKKIAPSPIKYPSKGLLHLSTAFQ